jgi:serine/threonine protein kinase
MLPPIKVFKPIRSNNDNVNKNKNTSRKRARSSPISPENLARLSPENRARLSKTAENEEKEDRQADLEGIYFKVDNFPLTEEDILHKNYDATKYYVKTNLLNNERKPFSEETAYLIKDIFILDETAKEYLSPLLFQFFKDEKVYQVFDGTGIDLNYLDKDTYVKNRARIEQTLFEALQFLHSKHILHRDITPDNMVWNADSTRAKLIDLDLLVKLQPNTTVYLAKNSYGTIPSRGEKINSLSRRFTKNRNVYGLEISLAILDEVHGLSPRIQIPTNIKNKYTSKPVKGGALSKNKTQRKRKV